MIAYQVHFEKPGAENIMYVVGFVFEIWWEATMEDGREGEFEAAKTYILGCIASYPQCSCGRL